jgi:hypothetical protein
MRLKSPKQFGNSEVLQMNKLHKGLIVVALGAILMGVSASVLAAAAPSAKVHPKALQRGQIVNRIAAVEGVTLTVLRQDLQAGQTLLQIAGAKYASADDLATALLSAFQNALNTSPRASKLTASQKAALYARLHARVAHIVATPHPKLRMLIGGKLAAAGGAGGARSSLVATLAATCNSTAPALQAAFKAGGQSPLAICQATNPTATQASLVTAIANTLRARIAKHAKAIGLLTAQQKRQILQRILARLASWVTTPLPTSA